MDSDAIARLCVRVAVDKKAEDLVLLDMRDTLRVVDWFLIATARNRRQMDAIGAEVLQMLKAEGVKDAHVEGKGSERWVLLDFGPVIVHLFDAPTRAYYDLESLWADSPRADVARFSAEAEELPPEEPAKKLRP